jgi:hypothetical protein
MTTTATTREAMVAGPSPENSMTAAMAPNAGTIAAVETG